MACICIYLSIFLSFQGQVGGFSHILTCITLELGVLKGPSVHHGFCRFRQWGWEAVCFFFDGHSLEFFFSENPSTRIFFVGGVFTRKH